MSLLAVVYVIQKSKQIRTKTIVHCYCMRGLWLCMSFKKVNKYGLKQCERLKNVCRKSCVCHSKK